MLQARMKDYQRLARAKAFVVDEDAVGVDEALLHIQHCSRR